MTRPNAPLLPSERDNSRARTPEHDAKRAITTKKYRLSPEAKARRLQKAKEDRALLKAALRGEVIERKPPPPPDPRVASDYIKRMYEQAVEAGITPQRFLLSLVAGEAQLRDTRLERGQLVEYWRYPTPAERQKAAETLQPYFEQKKAENVNTEITIRHVLPETTLDQVTLDEQGRVVEVGEPFEEIDYVDVPDSQN